MKKIEPHVEVAIVTYENGDRGLMQGKFKHHLSKGVTQVNNLFAEKSELDLLERVVETQNEEVISALIEEIKEKHMSVISYYKN